MLSTKALQKIENRLVGDLNKKLGYRCDLEDKLWDDYSKACAIIKDKEEYKKIITDSTISSRYDIIKSALCQHVTITIPRWVDPKTGEGLFINSSIGLSSPYNDINLFTICITSLRWSATETDIRSFIKTVNKLTKSKLGDEINHDIIKISEYDKSKRKISDLIDILKRQKNLTLRDLKTHTPWLYEYYNK